MFGRCFSRNLGTLRPMSTLTLRSWNDMAMYIEPLGRRREIGAHAEDLFLITPSRAVFMWPGPPSQAVAWSDSAAILLSIFWEWVTVIDIALNTFNKMNLMSYHMLTPFLVRALSYLWIGRGAVPWTSLRPGRTSVIKSSLKLKVFLRCWLTFVCRRPPTTSRAPGPAPGPNRSLVQLPPFFPHHHLNHHLLHSAASYS